MVAADTLSHKYPYGKQKKKPGGMWYTPVSGIWQSVWLERVPSYYIEKVKLTPDLEGVDIEVMISGKLKKEKKAPEEDREQKIQESPAGFSVAVTLHTGQIIQRTFDGRKGRIRLSDIILEDGNTYIPKLWTTDEPYLYSMTVSVLEDKVETYFALRLFKAVHIHPLYVFDQRQHSAVRGAALLHLNTWHVCESQQLGGAQPPLPRHQHGSSVTKGDAQRV